MKKTFHSLRDLRKSLGLTQEQLADKADVRRATITDIENGKAGSIGIYKKIAEAVGFEFEYYFKRKGS